MLVTRSSSTNLQPSVMRPVASQIDRNGPASKSAAAPVQESTGRSVAGKTRSPVGVPGPDLDSDRVPALGLESFAYSRPDGGRTPLLHDPDHPHYVAGGIGTPPEAGRLDQGGAANFLNPAWREQVELAVDRNGGLGNAQDGYLAWSKEFGFVRLKHVGLSADQNRRLAEISLQTGFSVEDLPTRTSENGFEKPEIFEWVDEFIGRFDREFQGFLADPIGDPLRVKSGKRRYVLEYNENAGGFVSYEYKKKGGLGGFVQQALGKFAPVLDVFAVAGHAIPGVGTAVALGAQAVKAVGSVIATGKLQARQLVAALGNYLLPGSLSGATSGQLALLGGAHAAAELIDTGKLRPSAIAAAAAPLIEGLPGGAVVDNAVKQGLAMAASAAQGGRIGVADVVRVLDPLITDLRDRSGIDPFEVLAGGIATGRFTARDAADVLAPLLGSVTGDPRLDGLLTNALGVVADGIDRKQFGPFEFLRAAAPWFERVASDLETGVPLRELLEDIASTNQLTVNEVVRGILRTQVERS